MKRQRIQSGLLALALVLLAGTPTLSKEQEGRRGGNLSELMHSNHENLKAAVDPAYFTSVERKLGRQDFEQIRKSAEKISANAKQTRIEFTRGEKFNKIAQRLEEHAGKAALAASRGKLPEVNVQIGEMTEYCAACHDAFRW